MAPICMSKGLALGVEVRPFLFKLERNIQQSKLKVPLNQVREMMNFEMIACLFGCILLSTLMWSNDGKRVIFQRIRRRDSKLD